MSFISEIEKTTEETFWFILFDLVFLIAPGFILLFYSSRDLFLTLDTIKLILLSVSFVAPFVFINSIFLALSIRNGEAKKEDTFICFTLGILLTNIIFYIALLISYFLKLSLANTLFSILALEVILLSLVKMFAVIIRKNIRQ